MAKKARKVKLTREQRNARARQARAEIKERQRAILARQARLLKAPVPATGPPTALTTRSVSRFLNPQRLAVEKIADYLPASTFGEVPNIAWPGQWRIDFESLSYVALVAVLEVMELDSSIDRLLAATTVQLACTTLDPKDGRIVGETDGVPLSYSSSWESALGQAITACISFSRRYQDSTVSALHLWFR